MNFFSLQQIFVAGEHCDYEVKSWAERVFKVPILNHWWQTEIGHPITCTSIGYGMSLNPPKYCVGLPVPGFKGMYYATKSNNQSSPVGAGSNTS